MTRWCRHTSRTPSTTPKTSLYIPCSVFTKWILLFKEFLFTRILFSEHFLQNFLYSGVRSHIDPPQYQFRSFENKIYQFLNRNAYAIASSTSIVNSFWTSGISADESRCSWISSRDSLWKSQFEQVYVGWPFLTSTWIFPLYRK